VDNLRTYAAIAAASALGCTTEALASRPELRLDVLKRYLGACTRFRSLYGMEDVSILIPQLEQVVQREPRFLPARKQLLLAGAFLRSIPTEVAKPSPQWLRAQIEAARRIEPSMPELRLAELELLPMTDFAGRIRLVDSLREEHPDDMFVLGARAEQLMLVGRINEAVVDAERTARLDPLASYSRSEYIRALAFSGRLSRAFEELNEFQPFSPVAMNLTDTSFRLNMRYGDPQPALKILRTYGTSKAHEAFLLARIDPKKENIERAMAIARSVALERGFYATPIEVLAVFGRDDEAHQLLMQMPPARVDQFMLQTLFRPTLRNLRQNPRFLRVAQRFGLLDYWRNSGKWPDFCFEPDLPYDCKKEAAKLTA
jgi:tetratricopeptide (TPR) repeat protein